MNIGDLVFSKKIYCEGENVLYTARVDIGRITVLDRLTGYGFGIRDIETGYKDNDGTFWLASGDFDIRQYQDIPVELAVEMIKNAANTCVAVRKREET